MIVPEKLAAIVLASGRSRRFGPGDKRVWRLGGEPLIFWPLRAARSLGIENIFIVAEASNEELAGIASRVGASIIHNASPDLGIDYSRWLGIEAASNEGVDAALILLADMPFVPASHLVGLVAKLEHKDAAMSVTAGVPGPPIAIGRAAFHCFAPDAGGAGGKGALQTLRRVAKVPLSDWAAFDIDTAEDAARAQAMAERSLCGHTD